MESHRPKPQESSSCIVTFNANGGEPALEPQIVTQNSKLGIPASVSKEGYTFGGWYRDELCTELWDFAVHTVKTAMALYAKWNAITYTVVFNANNGLGNMANLTLSYGVSQNLRSNTFTRSGFIFAGWALSAEGDVEFINGQSVINLTATSGDVVTLYAKWGTYSYSVVYNANEGSGVMANSVLTNGISQKLSPNLFTRTGYVFSGWARTADGIVEFIDEQNVVNLADTAGAVITLYAKWVYVAEGSFSVSFISNGGSSVASQIVSRNGKVTQPENPTRSAYAFMGWYKNSDFISGSEWNFADSVTDNITLYARWQALSGTLLVRFIANGGIPVPHDQAVSRNNIVIEPSIDKANATFGGWYRDSSLTIPWLFNSDTVSAPLTLYAKWNEDGKFTVNFFTNGGVPAWFNTAVMYGYGVDVPEGMIRAGYTADWYEDAALTNRWDFNSDYIIENTVLYAKWTVNTLSIMYSNGGGTGVAPANPVSAAYDVNITMPANTYTRADYTFAGWEVSGFGSKAGIYAASASVPVSDLSSAIDTGNASITLTATWAINNYAVTFNAKGGNPVSEQNISHGGTASRPEDMVYSGYAFDNWYADESLTVVYTFDTPVTGDITLYAKWIPDSFFTVTFAQIIDAAPFIDDLVIHRSEDNGNLTATLSVDNPGQYDSIEWHIPRANIRGYGPSFTLNSANTAYNNIGEHFLTVEVVKGGIPYSQTITFTVEE